MCTVADCPITMRTEFNTHSKLFERMHYVCANNYTTSLWHLVRYKDDNIPGHMGIHGSEIADQRPKAAAQIPSGKSSGWSPFSHHTLTLTLTLNPNPLTLTKIAFRLWCENAVAKTDLSRRRHQNCYLFDMLMISAEIAKSLGSVSDSCNLPQCGTACSKLQNTTSPMTDNHNMAKN